MADAKITLSLTPREFDTVRTVLGEAVDRGHEYIKSGEGDQRVRAVMRQRIVELQLIIDKLT